MALSPVNALSRRQQKPDPAQLKQDPADLKQKDEDEFNELMAGLLRVYAPPDEKKRAALQAEYKRWRDEKNRGDDWCCKYGAARAPLMKVYERAFKALNHDAGNDEDRGGFWDDTIRLSGSEIADALLEEKKNYMSERSARFRQQISAEKLDDYIRYFRSRGAGFYLSASFYMENILPIGCNDYGPCK